MRRGAERGGGKEGGRPRAGELLQLLVLPHHVTSDLWLRDLGAATAALMKLGATRRTLNFGTCVACAAMPI